MIEVPEDCELVFCVGVGGVGKTTFAASLALREALRGKSVLVLTADPARRLADALGIRSLRDTPSDIALPETASGELHAAMLETKASADEIIRRAAPDAGRAQRVLDNRIYQAFSNTLARSHAYAAMERVHEAIRDPRYDLVVVDTPPAQSSIEILDAPARLVRFLDQRVVRWFLRATEDGSGVRRGPLAQRLLRKVAGDSLVAALTEFLTEMAFLREGFVTRAREVHGLMQTPKTRFVLVSAADAMGIAAASSVAREVDDRGFALASVVFNRAFVPEIASTPPAGGYPESLSSVAAKLTHMREVMAAEQARKYANMVELAARLRLPAWALPEATRPLGDTSALSAWISKARAV